MTVETPINLVGTVSPINATNTTIVWSIVSGHASINGNYLTASAAGIIKVLATIVNGTAIGSDFKKEFSIDAVGPLFWHIVPVSNFDMSNIYGIAFDDGSRFLAVGASGKMAYSDNGGSYWLPLTSGLFSSDIKCAASYENWLFVVGCENGQSAYSKNRGINWTIMADSTFDSLNSVNRIIHVKGRFVAVGDNGQIARSNFIDVEEQLTWTTVTANIFSDNIYGIASGDDRLVVVGENGGIAYSDDAGVTWTNVSVGISGATLQDIVYADGLFVAVGQSGLIKYSDNGINWIEIDNSIFGNIGLNGVTYGNGYFVAVGNNGKIVYSINGVDWIADTNSPVTNNLSGITFYEDHFIAVGWNGTMVWGDWWP
jgi:photosystem II stability/assembly factor-like uncharacterized protein